MFKLTRRLASLFRRGEPGFAMVAVLVAMVMLSVLGAAGLLLMVSSMKGIVNITPEERALLVAEAGLYAAHAAIVEGKWSRDGGRLEGEILGGRYSAQITPKQGSTTDFIVTSLGVYEDRGSRTLYRRKVQEEVYYSGEQAFDALRNYLFFAGRDLNITMVSDINWIPAYLIGNLRAERDVKVYYYARDSRWHGLVVQGRVEGGNGVYLEGACRNYYTGTVTWPTGTYYTPNPNCVRGTNVLFYGDIRAGSAVDPRTQGTVVFRVWSGTAYGSEYWREGASAIFAASGGPGQPQWKIYAPTPPVVQRAADHDLVYQGEFIEQRGVGKIYIPRPNLQYYKILALQQGNYREGNWTITGDINRIGTSSLTVFYCTGNITVSDINVRPNVNAVFVCEGNFLFRNEHRMATGAKIQVIAGGDATFDQSAVGRWDNILTNEYFFYAFRDANINLNTISTQRQQQAFVQVTALRDVNVTQPRGTYNYPKFFYRAPQIDIGAWPIDIVVTNWKELPVDVE